MFNPSLQQTISPAQEVAAPSGVTAAASALSSVLSFGQGVLKNEMIKEEKEKKDFVDERVSTAALSFMDVYSNASARNPVAVRQKTDNLIRDLQGKGYSNSEIAAAIKQANTLSGASISSAIKLERDEVESAQKDAENLRKNVAELYPYVDVKDLEDDLTLPSDPDKLQAVILKATARKAAIEAEGLEARTRASQASAKTAQIELLSLTRSNEYSIMLTGILRDSLSRFKGGGFPEAQVREEIISGRLMVEKAINNDPEILPAQKAALIQGINASSALLEDIVTGKTNADLTTQQQSAKIQMVMAAALDSDRDLLSMVVSSNFGFARALEDFKIIDDKSLDVFYINPNKEDTNDERVVPIQVGMVTPAKALKTEEDAAPYIKLFEQAFTSNGIQEDIRMSRKDGAYLSFVEVIADKKNAENLSELVLGNEEVINSFMGASSKALGLYVSSVANLKVSGDMLDTKRVKDSMRVVISGKYPEVRIENPVKGTVKTASGFSGRSVDESIYFKQAQDSVVVLNRIMRTQHEAAVNIDRVAGTNLAGEIVNLQTQMLRQFIQE